MAEKFKYGPLIYNSIADETDDGNFWWSGSPPVAYEEESGPYRIPIDANGNQCLPGECILHPNCRVEEWESFELFRIPSLSGCKAWFEDNFLIVSDYDVCRYILRWCSYNYGNDFYQWKMNKTINEIVGEIWPDVQT